MRWLLQNLLGRPARTILTVSGIAVGIFALILLGGIAEQINRLIAGGEKFLTGQILVLPRGGGFTGILNVEMADRIRAVPGVAAVAPGFTMMLDDGHGANGLSLPPMIQTIDPSSDFRNRNLPRLPLRAGRYPRPGERGVVMLGRDLAQDRRWRNGDAIRLRGRVFKVIGLLERTFTGPDVWPLSPRKTDGTFSSARICWPGCMPRFTGCRDRESRRRGLGPGKICLLSFRRLAGWGGSRVDHAPRGPTLSGSEGDFAGRGTPAACHGYGRAERHCPRERPDLLAGRRAVRGQYHGDGGP